MCRTATAANAIFVYKHERNVCKGRPSSALNCLNKYIIKRVFVHGLYDMIPVCVTHCDFIVMYAISKRPSHSWELSLLVSVMSLLRNWSVNILDLLIYMHCRSMEKTKHKEYACIYTDLHICILGHCLQYDLHLIKKFICACLVFMMRLYEWIWTDLHSKLRLLDKSNFYLNFYA